MFIDLKQKQTGIVSDTIYYIIHFWREFEIRKKKVIYISSLIDIAKDFFFLLVNWKMKIKKNALLLTGTFFLFLQAYKIWNWGLKYWYYITIYIYIMHEKIGIRILIEKNLFFILYIYIIIIILCW